MATSFWRVISRRVTNVDGTAGKGLVFDLAKFLFGLHEQKWKISITILIECIAN